MICMIKALSHGERAFGVSDIELFEPQFFLASELDAIGSEQFGKLGFILLLVYRNKV